MNKPMIKIYIVLAVSAVLCVLFLPHVLGYTSAWGSDTSVRIRLMGQPAQAAEATPEEARIIFVMDDGWETQYTNGYKILKKYNYAGCIAVIPAVVDTEQYMTYSELADLYLDGWDMLNHTDNHVLLPGMTQDDQAEQMNNARKWLESHSLTRGSNVVVFPGGEFDSATLDALNSNQFAAGRSLNSLWTSKAGCILEDVEICSIFDGVSFDYVQAAIDKAIRGDSTLILVIHKIEPVTDDHHMQVPAEDLSRIVDYIHDHEDDLSVITMTQLINAE